MRRLQHFKRLRILEARRLMYGQSEFERAALHRTDVQRLTPAGGPVRLGENGADRMLRGQQLQGGNCEVRRAGEAQLQRRDGGVQCSKSRRVRA